MTSIFMKTQLFSEYEFKCNDLRTDLFPPTNLSSLNSDPQRTL